MREAIATFERLGMPWEVAACYLYLARLDTRFGDRDAAIEHYREALRCFEQVGSPDAEDVRGALQRLGEGV